MKTYTTLFALLISTSIFSQEFFYNTTPDFETSSLDKIATGLGIADINNDGWKDIVVANGNDIKRQHLEVYLNLGDGTFNNTPDWESEDVDYHGHLSIGDINNDGWLDVAVSVFIGPSGFDSPGKVKVYYNQNGELEKKPSFESEPFYSFSCALGDADADGDLDLAVACGESYHYITHHARIFINNEGVYDSIAAWKSEQKLGAMDCKFADFDQNGHLDVIFGCDQNPSTLFLSDNNGIIDTLADWQSDENINVNSLDINFINNDMYPDLVVSNNNQLPGDGKNRAWYFSETIPANSAASWVSNTVQSYRSGILLMDYNNDDTTDLIHGGWWQPLTFQNGTIEGFNQVSEFKTTRISVVEAIVPTDFDKKSWIQKSFTTTISKNTQSALSIPDNKVIEQVVNVYRNEQLYPNGYKWVPGERWITFESPLSDGETIKIEYMVAISPDLVVTNWDSDKGNYIYYNQKPINVSIETTKPNAISLYPNPTQGTVQLVSNDLIEQVKLYSIAGKLLYQENIDRKQLEINLTNYKSDIYLLEINSPSGKTIQKIVKY